MIELHERLSEFSYGYGVTREVELLLQDVGLSAVPFMPSLIHEKQIGFDVGFDRRGAPLLLQFKLGQSLARFRRTSPNQSIPALDRPFWRFGVDTAEPDGQFETLLKAEMDGAEVFYVAPRFSDWPHYARAFEDGEVLIRSVMLRPSEIRRALVGKGAPDGQHRIVYDRAGIHVCSEPTWVRDVQPRQALDLFASRIRSEGRTLEASLENVLKGFDDRSAVRRPVKQARSDDDARRYPVAGRAAPSYTITERRRRLQGIRARSRSEPEAVAAAVGTELWMLGIQMIMAVDDG